MTSSVCINRLYTLKNSKAQESDLHFFSYAEKMPKWALVRAPMSPRYELADEIIEFENGQEDGKYDEQHNRRHDNDQKRLHDAE